MLNVHGRTLHFSRATRFAVAIAVFSLHGNTASGTIINGTIAGVLSIAQFSEQHYGNGPNGAYNDTTFGGLALGNFSVNFFLDTSQFSATTVNRSYLAQVPITITSVTGFERADDLLTTGAIAARLPVLNTQLPNPPLTGRTVASASPTDIVTSFALSSIARADVRNGTFETGFTSFTKSLELSLGGTSPLINLGPTQPTTTADASQFWNSVTFQQSNPPQGTVLLFLNAGALESSILQNGTAEISENRNSSRNYRGDVTSISLQAASYQPSILDLAQASRYAYLDGSSAPGSLTPIGVYNGSGRFVATALREPDGDIVVAIRGTDLDKNWLANLSFANGGMTPELRSMLLETLNYLKQLQNENPESKITLAGHSLGGAIAQIVGALGDFRAVGFDSPGVTALVASARTDQSVQTAMVGLMTGGVPGGSAETYRIYGDQISLIGQQLGSVITIESPYPKLAVDQSPLGFASANHEIQTMLAQLIVGAPITDLGPNVAERIISPITMVLSSNPAAGLIAQLEFNFIVNDLLPFLFDPAGGNEYRMLVGAGSPFVKTLLFPFIDGMETLFRLEALIDGNWQLVGYFDEGATFDFGPLGVEAFRFFSLAPDRLTQILLGLDFAFGLSFVNTGEFYGKVLVLREDINPRSEAIPEPPTMFALVFGLIYCMTRRGAKYMKPSISF